VTRPADATEIALSMSNFDHTVDPGLAEALKAGNVYAQHAAWEFNGEVWFADGLFHEQVFRYHQPVGSYRADTLEELMTRVNDHHGWE
jgi:hypothetical protein